MLTVMSLEINSTQMLAHFIIAKSVMSASQSTFSVARKQLIWAVGGLNSTFFFETLTATAGG